MTTADLSGLNILAVNSKVSVTEGEVVEIPFNVSQPNGRSFEIEVMFNVMTTLLSAVCKYKVVFPLQKRDRSS